MEADNVPHATAARDTVWQLTFKCHKIASSAAVQITDDDGAKTTDWKKVRDPVDRSELHHKDVIDAVLKFVRGWSGNVDGVPTFLRDVDSFIRLLKEPREIPGRILGKLAVLDLGAYVGGAASSPSGIFALRERM